MGETLKAIADKAVAALPGAVIDARFSFGELTLLAERERILDVLKFLRDDPDGQFVCFTDITAADYPEREKRFEVIYHLLSPRKNIRVRVKISTDEATPAPSAIGVFPEIGRAHV